MQNKNGAGLLDAIKGSAKASLIGTLALGAMLGACNKNPPAEPAGQGAEKADQKAQAAAKPEDAKLAAPVAAIEALYRKFDTCFDDPAKLCVGEEEFYDNALKGLIENPDALIAFFAKHQAKVQFYGKKFKAYDDCMTRPRDDSEDGMDLSEKCAEELGDGEGGYPREIKGVYELTKKEADHAQWLKDHQLADGYRALWALVDEAREPDLTEDRAKEIAQEIVKLMKAGLKPDVANWEGKTPILSVIHPGILQAMAQAGADLKFKDAQGNGVLHQKRVSEAMLQIALAAGAEINAKNAEGKTPVFYVSDPEVLKAFVKAGADLKVKDQKGDSPIQSCVHSIEDWPWAGIHTLDQDCLKIYREAGVDPHAKDAQGETLYTRLFKQGIAKETYDAIVADGFDVKTVLPDFMKTFKQCFRDCERGFHWNPLSTYQDEACDQIYDFYEELIPSLIKAGLDVQARDPETGNSYLFYVSSEETANALIKAGLDVNAKNKEGKTALYFKHESPATGALKAMVKAGGQTSDDLLSIHLETLSGADHGPFDIMTYEVPCMLLKHDASRYSKGAIGKLLLTYLSHDIWSEEYSLCEGEKIPSLLLKLGADLTVRDEKGRTVLMVTEEKEVIEQLIKAGADVNAKDNEGKSVLQHHEDAEILEMLKAAGAK